MNGKPTAILSYSHADKEFVEKLYNDLREQGIDVWMDKFEINPGDSLIEKIFDEGLGRSQFFLVVLSKESVTSRWVREELATAMSLRLEGVIKVIPLLKEPCEIPVALRSLMYVKLYDAYEDGLKQLVQTLFAVSSKPPVGTPPDYITSLKRSVGGLSELASTVGDLLIRSRNDESGYDPQITPSQFAEVVPHQDPNEIREAVDELESYGLVKAHRVLGNPPWGFAYVNATYALFLHYRNSGLDYDPEEDIKQVAASIAANGEVTGEALREQLNLPPGRVNRAVAYLDDYGLARVNRRIGTAPFSFRDAEATWQTKKFVKDGSL